LLVDIELDTDRLEKGLERAARRLSQKHTIPGFRKGKAPRFIIENYFGRAALLEEASEDLINRSFREALEQEQIEPVGTPTLESIEPSETFRFKVSVPAPPSVTVGDYRSIRVPLQIEPVTEEVVQRSLENRRDKHVVLKELEEPRPAQPGDQLTVKLQTFIDGEPVDQVPEGEEPPDSPLVLEEDRIVPELYEGLLGVSGDEEREITAQMPEDHHNEDVRGKEVTFKARVVGIQERMLPEWDELPTLEEFDGTLEDMREEARQRLEEGARSEGERQVVDSFIEQVVEQTEYDVPDVMIRDVGNEMLEQQGQRFAQYGITIDQMLQFRGETRDDAINQLLPEAEKRLKVRLALQQIVEREQIDITNEEIQEEAQSMLQSYDEETRNAIQEAITTQQEVASQFYTSVANTVLDRKLRERIIAIATGEAPELPEPADTPVEAAPDREPGAEPGATAGDDDLSVPTDTADTGPRQVGTGGSEPETRPE
jgi:trigger factor